MPKTTSKTYPEQERIFNLVPTPEESTSSDWVFADALEAGLARAPRALPSNIDLRTAWWTIGDQGNTGSCVGWSSTDGVARYMLVTNRGLAQNTKLSPRFTWMASKETDQFQARPQTMIEEAGTTLKAAVDVLRNYGAVPDALLPFKLGTTMYVGRENAFYATAATNKITSYFNLRLNLTQWRSWLVDHGPILAGFNVDDTWMEATATGGKVDVFQPNTVRGGHAVAVVGYTDDDRFIIRNSWGTGWGDDGFAYVSENYINAAFFNESYGVTV